MAVKILVTVDEKQLEHENAAGLLSLSSPILRVLQKVGCSLLGLQRLHCLRGSPAGTTPCCHQACLQ